ncbi:MAG: CoA pyrophosphatase [Gammaproteobacteria bacterium]
MKEAIRRRLEGTAPAPAEQFRVPGLSGDLPRALRHLRPRRVTPAAVLVPLLERAGGLTVLFTVRSEGLKHHAGQVSFPGGRLDPGDAGPREAALREAAEEVGLPAENVEVAGYLQNYLTITGYSVTPVVGFVDPAFRLALDPTEVSEAFEVPLDYLFAPGNMQRRYKRYLGVRLPYFEIPWGPHRIWGATAAMLVNFRDSLEEDS